MVAAGREPLLTSAMGVLQTYSYTAVNTDWHGLVSMLCVSAKCSLLDGDPVSTAHWGKGILLAHQGSNVPLDQTPCSTLIKQALEKYFLCPSTLHIPQTKHCYVMILNIFLKVIMATLKGQQTLGRRVFQALPAS